MIKSLAWLPLAALATVALASPAFAQAAASPNAGFWDIVNPYLSQGASWVVGAAVTLAAAQVTRYTGLQIRQTWLDKINAAADTGIHVGLSGVEGWIDTGLTKTQQMQVVAKGVTWVKGNLGSTLSKLGMTPDQLEGIVIKQLGKAAISAMAPTGASVESPAMARAAGPDR